MKKRNLVTLEIKIKVIHLMMEKKNSSEVEWSVRLTAKELRIFSTIVISGLIWKNQGLMSIRCASYAKFKPIDNEVVNFINFVRYQRLPGTKSR